MQPRENRHRLQFQLRHPLGLTLGAAVLFAVVAPEFRKLDLAGQLNTSLQSVAVMVTVIGMMVALMIRRHKIERSAGTLIERFERRSSRIWNALIAGSLWSAYVASVWSAYQLPNRQNEFHLLPGSPILLFCAINFIVVRTWWRIDPTGLEACERGLVIGGFQFHPWDAVSRYSWTGASPRQLNLFLKHRFVLNLKTDASFIPRLDPILAAKLPAPPTLSAAAATAPIPAHQPIQ